jgi:hypothetical protein
MKESGGKQFLYLNRIKILIDGEEIIELESNNSQYEVETAEYDLLVRFFEPDLSEKKFYSATKIIDYLKDVSRQQLDATKMGLALKKMKIKRTFTGNLCRFFILNSFKFN